MAQVFVWLPSFGLSGLENVGHASLLADRARTQEYVSWWPNGGVNKQQTGTSGHFNNTYASDVESEGGRLPITIDLPCLEDQPIADWWSRVRDSGFAVPYSFDVLPKSNNYELYSNNCSTIVFRAMLMGGATRFVDFPKFDTITPPHILAWAKMIAAAASAKQWLSIGQSKLRSALDI